MIFPRSHAFTLSQRLLIVGGAFLAVGLLCAFVYAYERYYRGPTESVFYGTWEIEGCMDCTAFLTLTPTHKVISFTDSLGSRDNPSFSGRWYAGGELLVIHYDTPEESQSVILRILDITPNTLRLRVSGSEVVWRRSDRVPPQSSNKSLQPTASRRTTSFSDD
jgi:hypothetical protein